MPQRMAKVQETPLAMLELILLHYGRLDRHITADKTGKGGLVLLIKAQPVFFQLFKKDGILYTGVLDDLRKTVDPFPLRQGLQQAKIIQEKLRLPDGADKVLIKTY